ncbi:hypothetical protein [Micrococcus luteus]|uniref:hypothetical protein n=1 Tax=Micrococcus luteus TaxID=1270 RepID=UPI0011AAE803|nr:hypothetical protein [Micrococcus luteus]
MAENPEDLIVTDAELRRQLPALAKELKIGGSGGGVYYDATGKAVKYVYVVSATDPGKTRVVDGETVEVWWVQTTPPDPMQSTPIGVTQNVAGRSYTVPSDPVATYTVGGSLKAPGTYPIGTSAATTLTWTATAKSGYGFKPDAVTTGTLTWPVKTYASGDVLLSDDFNDRAEGAALGGTMTNSYAGGEPVQWVTGIQNYYSDGRSDAKPWLVKSGVARSEKTTLGRSTAQVTLPTAAPAMVIEYDAWPAADLEKPLDTVMLKMPDGEFWITGGGSVSRPKVGGALTVHSVITIRVGDRVRLTYYGTDVPPKFENITTGVIAAYVNNDPTRNAIRGAVTGIKLDLENTSCGIDNLKVYIP